MYRTHIQCPDVGQAAWPEPASLSARDLHSELGESIMETDSPAAGNPGQGALSGHPVGIILGRGRQGWAGAWLKSWLIPFVLFVQALLLLAAPTSAFAATEANQEIGIPTKGTGVDFFLMN